MSTDTTRIKRNRKLRFIHATNKSLPVAVSRSLFWFLDFLGFVAKIRSRRAVFLFDVSKFVRTGGGGGRSRSKYALRINFLIYPADAPRHMLVYVPAEGKLCGRGGFAFHDRRRGTPLSKHGQRCDGSKSTGCSSRRASARLVRAHRRSDRHL